MAKMDVLLGALLVMAIGSSVLAAAAGVLLWRTYRVMMLIMEVALRG